MQAIATQDKNPFESELRKRDAEFRHLSQENFDLKLKIHQLQRQIQSKAEPRRASASPEPDNFYDFDDDKGLDPSSSRASISLLEDKNPIILKLRRELADLRAEIEDLVENNNHLDDTLDDLREKNIADMEKAAQELRGQHAQIQTLVNQGEDLQSENLHLQIELSQAREAVEVVKVEMDQEREMGKERERRELAMRTRADGFHLQFKAAVAALEEEKKKSQVAASKVEDKSMQVVTLQKQLEEIGLERSRLKDELGKEQREKNVAQESLKIERERAGIWEEIDKLVEKGEALFEDGGGLEELVGVLQMQRERYDGMEYQPRWREMVMNDLNDCLRLLYRSQRQVEAKRQLIVNNYLNTPSLHENPTTHVS